MQILLKISDSYTKAKLLEQFYSAVEPQKMSQTIYKRIGVLHSDKPLLMKAGVTSWVLLDDVVTLASCIFSEAYKFLRQDFSYLVHGCVFLYRIGFSNSIYPIQIY